MTYCNTTTINIINQIETDGIVHCGMVQVVASVYGFNKRAMYTDEVFEKCECSLPPMEYETCAFWIDLPVAIKRKLELDGFGVSACMHTANHVLVSISNIYAQCDVNDIATEHDTPSNTRSHPFRVMLYGKSIFVSISPKNPIYFTYMEKIVELAVWEHVMLSFSEDVNYLVMPLIF